MKGKKARKKMEHRRRTLKHYRQVVQDLRKVLLHTPVRDPLDDLLLYRASLPMANTTKSHHFNGGITYINEQMFVRLPVSDQRRLLVKYALYCTSWMENRLGVKPYSKTRKQYRELC